MIPEVPWTGVCGSNFATRFKACFSYLWREGSVWGNLEGQAQRRLKIQAQRGSGKNLPISKIKRAQQKQSIKVWPGDQRKPKIISTRTKLTKAQTGKQN